jgi:hypothetical protein
MNCERYVQTERTCRVVDEPDSTKTLKVQRLFKGRCSNVTKGSAQDHEASTFVTDINDSIRKFRQTDASLNGGVWRRGHQYA